MKDLTHCQSHSHEELYAMSAVELREREEHLRVEVREVEEEYNQLIKEVYYARPSR